MINALVFDWGDTVMKDFNLPGPMSEWEKVEWVEGAEEALMKLNKKFTCIIATSADHSDTIEMKKALSRVGADKYFHYFFSQKELGYKKPDVRFFRQVMLQAGFNSSECAMIGNLYDKDIIGAKEAGMKTVFFNQSSLEGEYPLADFQIDKMKQLLDLF
jgi:putative hydrolase of the HAD superfamily